MINKVKSSVVISAAAAWLSLSHGTAHATCYKPGQYPWGSAEPITVAIHEDMQAQLCDATIEDACPSQHELSTAISVVLDEYYDTGSSPLRFQLDPTPDTKPLSDLLEGQVVAGKIIIWSGPCTGDSSKWPASTLGREDSLVDGLGNIIGSTVQMCSENDNGNVFWDAVPDVGEIKSGAPLDASGAPIPPRSFTQVLLHELGHSIGLAHPSECLPVPHTAKTIMDNVTDASADSSHLFAADIDALQEGYGFRNDVGRAVGTTNGLTWWNGWSAPSEAVYALSRMSACNSAGRFSIPVVFGDDTYRDVWFTMYDDLGWTTTGSLFWADTDFHSGIACQDDSMIFHTWLDSAAGSSSGQQTLKYSFSQDRGATWFYPPAGFPFSTETTSQSGVNATYDPSSGKFVVVWKKALRQNGRITATGQVRVQVFHPTLGTSGVATELPIPGTGGAYRTSDTPNVACGNPNTLGYWNCMIAWSDAEWYRTVKWSVAHVDGTSNTLVLADVRTFSPLAWGTPSVAYREELPYPWTLVLHQGGYTTFTWRKTTAPSQDWQDQKSFQFLPKIVSPSAGSRWYDKAYAFLTDT